MDLQKLAIFAGGLLCGTAGVKLLKSKEAKKVYAHTTAAALRAKECVMTDVTKVREGCGDIVAEAKEINEKKSSDSAVEIIEDTCE
ncbi:MAG: hypothetical protein E7493_10105 [Ruminococcus albus]|nr:hypothetical protein [Ruminococcus albus]